MTISFFKLGRLFPKDTMWVNGCAEIIGYSPKENLHIVITDGNCVSDNGEYFVTKYKPKDPAVHYATCNLDKYPYKYLSEEEMISQEWINFNE
jgi:hypothetical protein